MKTRQVRLADDLLRARLECIPGGMAEDVRAIGEELAANPDDMRVVLLVTIDTENRPVITTVGLSTLEAVGVLEIAKRLFLSENHQLIESS